MNPGGITEIECLARVASNAWRLAYEQKAAHLWGGGKNDSHIFAFDSTPLAEFVYSVHTEAAHLITARMRDYAVQHGYGVDEFNTRLRREAEMFRTPLPESL